MVINLLLHQDETETYNGTSFTEVADLSTGRRYLAGFGTQTAAVAAGEILLLEEQQLKNGMVLRGTNPNSLPLQYIL